MKTFFVFISLVVFVSAQRQTGYELYCFNYVPRELRLNHIQYGPVWNQEREIATGEFGTGFIKIESSFTDTEERYKYGYWYDFSAGSWTDGGEMVNGDDTLSYSLYQFVATDTLVQLDSLLQPDTLIQTANFYWDLRTDLILYPDFRLAFSRVSPQEVSFY